MPDVASPSVKNKIIGEKLSVYSICIRSIAVFKARKISVAKKCCKIPAFFDELATFPDKKRASVDQ
uniref:Uncharacterized protein n=1 Tax=Romanomermis culicivorax TaxID=13658 RepID=A0A915J5P1_ROMCU